MTSYLNPIANATVVPVTPDLASEWLAKAIDDPNRTINQRVVAAYARDMAGGQWRFTGEAIKFSSTGRLLDGQHRLRAIVRADVTIPTLVVRELDDAAQANMDTGRKRTVGDALGIKGEKRASLQASIAAMIASEGDSKRVSSTPAELLAVVDAEPMIRVIANDILPQLQIKVCTATVQGYLYWLLDRVDSSDCAKFFYALSTLADLPATSPILALHRRLAEHGRGLGSGRGRAYRQEVVAYTIQAWNAWRRGQPRSIVKLSYLDGKLSVPDPI